MVRPAFPKLHLAYVAVLWIAQDTATDGFSEPIPLCHPLDITTFTWATEEHIISVSQDGFLRRWQVSEVNMSDRVPYLSSWERQAFFLYELFIGVEMVVKLVLYENHMLVVAGVDTISRYVEYEGSVRKYEIMQTEGLNPLAVALHGCGKELTYAAGSFL
jgi:hypothetical protein